MDQIHRVCTIPEHDQRQIMYVCMYPNCNLNRLLCTKCAKLGIHQHELNNQFHILDNKELYTVLKEKLDLSQGRYNINMNLGGKNDLQALKQLIKDLKNQLQIIINKVYQMEQIVESNNYGNYLHELLFKLKYNGFQQFDDQQLKNLLAIDQENQVDDIYSYLQDQSENIINEFNKIKKWCQHQQIDKKELSYQIKNAKYNLVTYQASKHKIYASAISNDFKYVVSGGSDQALIIWNYNDITQKKKFQLDDVITQIKFTQDSSLLYVGTKSSIYQFDCNNEFKETYNQSIHLDDISSIFCITSTIILTSSYDTTIVKTDINLKQQLLLIKAHNECIYAMDFNHNMNMIASGSEDTSIKLWSGADGQLILEKEFYHEIQQVIFLRDQLISLDESHNLIIWEINQFKKKLIQLLQIFESNSIYCVSAVLDQQYLTLVCDQYVVIYSTRGDIIRTFLHDADEIYFQNISQPRSMKAIIIQGVDILQICQIDFH